MAHGPGLALGTLSPREQQVAQLVAGGLKDAVIARRLGISPSTVHTHVARIRWRLKLDRRSDIASATPDWRECAEPLDAFRSASDRDPGRVRPW